MEAGWSARLVACQLGRSDCVVRRCWDQWIPEMSFIRRSGSGHTRQTSRRKDRYIVAPTLRDLVSSRTIRRRLAEGHLELRQTRRIWTCDTLDAHPSTPPFGVVPRTRKLDCSGMDPGLLY
ncbi:transposable element Tcb2 transposase [Trichonephila clavipes]|nr:transposable element Tcb2 transposase [Trichonephila clavipes]